MASDQAANQGSTGEIPNPKAPVAGGDGDRAALKLADRQCTHLTGVPTAQVDRAGVGEIPGPKRPVAPSRDGDGVAVKLAERDRVDGAGVAGEGLADQEASPEVLDPQGVVVAGGHRDGV